MNEFVHVETLEETVEDQGVGQPVMVRLIVQRKKLDNDRLGRKFATVEVTIGDRRPMFFSPDCAINLGNGLRTMAPKALALAIQLTLEAETERKALEEKKNSSERKTVRSNGRRIA